MQIKFMMTRMNKMNKMWNCKNLKVKHIKTNSLPKKYHKIFKVSIHIEFENVGHFNIMHP